MDAVLKEHLLSAATNGYAEVVEIILDEPEVDVDVTDTTGNSSLILAANGGHLEVVDLLLEKNANVNFLNPENISPIRAALAGGHSEVAELLLRDPRFDIDSCRWTPLNSAAYQGFVRVVRLLLDKGAKLDGKDLKEDATPLYMASISGHAKVVKRLLWEANSPRAKKGPEDLPSWEIPSRGGLTPLIAAATEGHSQVVQLLLSVDANLDTTGVDHETALKGATKNGHADVIKLLYEKMKANLKRQSKPLTDENGLPPILPKEAPPPVNIPQGGTPPVNIPNGGTSPVNVPQGGTSPVNNPQEGTLEQDTPEGGFEVSGEIPDDGSGVEGE